MPPKRSLFLLAMGQAIRECREARRVSQLWLAQKAGLTPNYLSDVENGKRNVSGENINKLVEALDLTWTQFGAEVDRVSRTLAAPSRRSRKPSGLDGRTS